MTPRFDIPPYTAISQRKNTAKELNRLGLGTMGISVVRNPESSVKTIHAALYAGTTLFNTGEFYNLGESELIIGQALSEVKRDSYFLSGKFGALPSPDGGIYGPDVKPHNAKGYPDYSLRCLGPDYIDLYQSASMDTTVPVDEQLGGRILSLPTGRWRLPERRSAKPGI